MKKYILLISITGCLLCCQKSNIDINNPDVKLFVEQLLSGRYNNYYQNEQGENLWLLMPEFTEDHIGELIEEAEDTSHIYLFPVNPISSRTPYPQGREYFILAECLLWAIEGVRNGTGYGSLDPYLIDNSKDETTRYQGLDGAEILKVRDLYKIWWTSNGNDNKLKINPLEGTSFVWF